MAGDLDFLPLVRALVESGAWVELWCDPVRTPRELIHAADSRVLITPRSVCDFAAKGQQLAHTIPKWEDCTYPPQIDDASINMRGRHELGWCCVAEDDTGPIAYVIRDDIPKASFVRHQDAEKLGVFFRYENWGLIGSKQWLVAGIGPGRYPLSVALWRNGNTSHRVMKLEGATSHERSAAMACDLPPLRTSR